MTIQHKTFTKPGRVPRSDELVLGQLAINGTDGKLYIELIDGSVICVGTDVNQLVSQFALNASFLLFEQAIDQDLANKSPIGHHHPTIEIDGLSLALNDLTTAIASKAIAVHGHQIADIGTLQDVLNGKANQAAVTIALNGKADTNHTHPAFIVPWDSPGAIGASAPNSGRFTTLNLTSNANTISSTTGAIICAGGAYFARNLQVGAQLQINDVLRHIGTTAGFFNVTPITKPIVTGTRSSGAALTSLLLGLKSLGLINDTTTA